MKLGVESLLAGQHAHLLSNVKRFALLANQASVDRQFRYTPHLLADCFPGKLASIFSPQHGFFSEQQDNMIETPHGRDLRLGVPIHSLYSETREPTAQMMTDIDAIVIDLQDVGTRVYTFVWSALACLRAAAEFDRTVIVLDRPNPLGNRADGPLLDMTFKSFVGMAPIPMQHGLTIGELMLFCNHHFAINAKLEVIRMEDYDAQLGWPATGLTWVPTSPNLPRYEGVVVYPGQVLFEGTRLSEGRGTTTPFEICGHPALDPFRWVDELCGFNLPGVYFRPIRFEPTFQKHARVGCGGVFLHVTEPAKFSSLNTTVALFVTAKRLLGSQFEWLPPPYEYEADKMPIDILWGSSNLREQLAAGKLETDDAIRQLTSLDQASWAEQNKDFRLY